MAASVAAAVAVAVATVGTGGAAIPSSSGSGGIRNNYEVCAPLICVVSVPKAVMAVGTSLFSHDPSPMPIQNNSIQFCCLVNKKAHFG